MPPSAFSVEIDDEAKRAWLVSCGASDAVSTKTFLDSELPSEARAIAGDQYDALGCRLWRKKSVRRKR